MIARCAVGDGILTVVFYPTLVVSEEDLAFGGQAVADAVGAVMQEDR